MLIGEVSRRCGVSTRMLRHYDTLGLVKPTGRTSGGYREYSADDIRRLFHVESLRTLGLSLNEAKRALDEPDFAPADLVGELMQHTRQRIAAEEELLTKLERVDASAPSEWDDVLRMVSLLRALESEFAAHRQQAILSQELNAALPVDALVEAILSGEGCQRGRSVAVGVGEDRRCGPCRSREGARIGGRRGSTPRDVGHLRDPHRGSNSGAEASSR